MIVAGLEVDYPNNIYDVPRNRDNVIPDPAPEPDDLEEYDNLVGATFLLDPTRNPENGGSKAHVVQMKTDALGNPIGKAHTNPLLDTKEYKVELEDGTYDSYFANMIAKNLWLQCDAEGCEFQIFHEIIDHQKDKRALEIEDGYTNVNG